MIELGKARERPRGRDPALLRTSRLVASLAFADELRARLDAGGVNRAELAREHRITRARVTQLLALLSLPVEVMGWIRQFGAREPALSERRLRPLLGATRRQQLEVFGSFFPSFQRLQRARA